MEEQYTQEQLKILDEILERFLKEYCISNIPDEDIWAYKVLEKEGAVKCEAGQFEKLLYATKNENNFDMYLAGGTFTERYYRNQEKNSKIQSITYNIEANNSNVAIGNQNNQNLTISISLFEKAIEQIKSENDLSDEEKEELIDLVSDLKTAEINKQSIGNTLLKKLAKWGERIIHLGGSLASMYQAYFPLIQ